MTFLTPEQMAIRNQAAHKAKAEAYDRLLRFEYLAQKDKYAISSQRPGPPGSPAIRIVRPFPSFEEWKSKRLETEKIMNAASMEKMIKVIAKSPPEARPELVKVVAQQAQVIARAPSEQKPALERRAVHLVQTKAAQVPQKKSWVLPAGIMAALALAFR